MSCNTNILDGSNSNDNDKILSLLKNGYYYDIQKLSDVNVDVNTLSSIVTSDANVCVILTKRIKIIIIMIIRLSYLISIIVLVIIVEMMPGKLGVAQRYLLWLMVLVD